MYLKMKIAGLGVVLGLTACVQDSVESVSSSAVLSSSSVQGVSSMAMPSSSSQKGALSSSAGLSSSVALVPVTYNGQIKTLMSTYCTACHNSGALNLVGYANVKAHGVDALAAMEAGTMPKGRALKPEELEAMKAWVNGQMPE